LKDGGWDCDIVLFSSPALEAAQAGGVSLGEGRVMFKPASLRETPPAFAASSPPAVAAVRTATVSGWTDVVELLLETRGGVRQEAHLPSPRTLTQDHALRVGWRHIRGLGEKTREALQQARAEGPFISIADVVRRAKLTRAEALHLARAGAFEAFESGRRKAAWEALRAAGDLLPLAPAHTLPFNPHELEGQELIFLDYLATGISVNGHPMEHLRDRLNDAGVTSSAAMNDMRGGERIVVAGLVVARQHPETAKGTVFLLLEDEFGFINVIVPRTLYAQYREVVKFAPFLVVEGKFEREERVMNVVGRRFRELKTQKIVSRSRDFH
jgi:error-prone DNA polymerase